MEQEQGRATSEGGERQARLDTKTPLGVSTRLRTSSYLNREGVPERSPSEVQVVVAEARHVGISVNAPQVLAN
jgi:hypothetical protein